MSQQISGPDLIQLDMSPFRNSNNYPYKEWAHYGFFHFFQKNSLKPTLIFLLVLNDSLETSWENFSFEKFYVGGLASKNRK